MGSFGNLALALLGKRPNQIFRTSKHDERRGVCYGSLEGKAEANDS